MPIVLKGMHELQTALKMADRGVRLAVTRDLREAAEPVRREAQTLTAMRIRNMTEPWARTRVGRSTKLVYVAPSKRGLRTTGHPLARPNLSRLILSRSFEPALQSKGPDVLRDMGQTLDRIASRFNRS